MTSKRISKMEYTCEICGKTSFDKDEIRRCEVKHHPWEGRRAWCPKWGWGTIKGYNQCGREGETFFIQWENNYSNWYTKSEFSFSACNPTCCCRCNTSLTDFQVGNFVDVYSEITGELLFSDRIREIEYSKHGGKKLNMIRFVNSRRMAWEEDVKLAKNDMCPCCIFCNI